MAVVIHVYHPACLQSNTRHSIITHTCKLPPPIIGHCTITTADVNGFCDWLNLKIIDNSLRGLAGIVRIEYIACCIMCGPGPYQHL